MKNKNFSNITKERIINNEIQLARIDNEKNFSYKSNFKNTKQLSQKNISFFKSIVISDYDKGFIDNKIMKIITYYSKKTEIPVFVDPKKSNPRIYKGANFISPNFKEFKKIFIPN